MFLSRIRLRPQVSATQLAHLLSDSVYAGHRLLWDLFSGQERGFLYREETSGDQLKGPSRRRHDPLYYVLSKQEPSKQNPLFEVLSKPYAPKLKVGERLAFRLRVNAVVTKKTAYDNGTKDRGLDKRGKPKMKRIRHDIVMDAQRTWLLAQSQALGVTQTGTKRDLKEALRQAADQSVLARWTDVIAQGPYREVLDHRLTPSDVLEWALKSAVDGRILNWWQAKAERCGFEPVQDEKKNAVMQAMAYTTHRLPEKGPTAAFSSLDLSGEIIVRDIDAFSQKLYQGIGPAKAFGCGLLMIRRL